MKYLVTGGCGFLGSNLAAEVLNRGDELFVVDNLGRLGSRENLVYLKSLGDFDDFQADIRNAGAMDSIIRTMRPDVVFHLAGQVAMTTSIADPRMDFEINALGTLNVLEAVRLHCPQAAVIYSSTNKVYGDLEWTEYAEQPKRYLATLYPQGFPESISLDFHSPYGCSKGAADQYMLDYARMFDMNTVVFRHSSMYGGRQYSTADQGWIGWFCTKAIEASVTPGAGPFTICGNGKQVRDVLHAADMVELYFAAAERIAIARGHAFNIGGGVANSLSLLELFDVLESELNIRLNYRSLPPRSSDQRVFIADITKAQRFLGWQPRVSYRDGVRTMLDWVREYVSI